MWAPRRWLARLAAVGFAIAAVGLVAAGGDGRVPPDIAYQPQPFLQPQSVVVASDRLVCSLLGEQGQALGIRGMDNGGVVALDGVVYWAFGDTLLADGRYLPNSIGRSEGVDASGCIELTPKEGAGAPAPRLTQVPGEELTVWPMGMAATGDDQIHFYYASVVSDAERQWRVLGVGIGSFDTETLTAERALGGALVWREGEPVPTRAFADERYVYTLHDISRAPWTKDTILARVRKDAVESPASYEYWDAGGAGEPGRWVAGLWNEETGSWDDRVAELPALWRQSGMHNGIEVAYNEFVGRWLAVYSTGFMSSVNVRAADELTGPWDGSEAVLIDCGAFHEAAEEGFLCYSGAQHEFYSRDGGRTIYLSYSNSDAYQPFLHELRLAAPITQWRDDRGRTAYAPGDGLDGFTADGTAFYASDLRAPGLTAIHRWEHLGSGAIQYEAAPPDPAGSYQHAGVAFYAPLDAAAAAATNALSAPVYRWRRDGALRYSPLDLAPAGFARDGVAFYAACPDADSDSLTDCAESFLGTDPQRSDSDGDGLSDSYELSMSGCHPLLYNDDRDGVSSLVELIAGGNPCLREAVAQVAGD